MAPIRVVSGYENSLKRDERLSKSLRATALPPKGDLGRPRFPPQDTAEKRGDTAGIIGH